MKNKLKKLALAGMCVALPFFGCKAPVEPLEYGDIVGKVTQPYITEDERIAYKPYEGINVVIPGLNKTTGTDKQGNFAFREVEEGIHEVQANTKYGILSKAISNDGYFDERYQTTKREVDVLGKPIESLGKSMSQSSVLEDTLEMLLIPQIGYITQILHGYVYNKDGTPYDNRALNLFGALSIPPKLPEGWPAEPEEPDWVRIDFLHPEEMTENKGRYAFYIGDNEYYCLNTGRDNEFFEFDTTTNRTYLSAYIDSLGIIEADAFSTSEKEE